MDIAGGPVATHVNAPLSAGVNNLMDFNNGLNLNYLPGVNN